MKFRTAGAAAALVATSAFATAASLAAQDAPTDPHKAHAHVPGMTTGHAPVTAERLAEVERRSADVMPFDLDGAHHVFAVAPDGGVQTVTTVRPEQVGTVRSHLREIAERFARGDFGAPAMVHGPSMPGLEELARGHASLRVTYSDVPDGGRIVYRSEDAAVAAAVRRWFEAQLRDHGRHAEPGGAH